MGTDSKIEWTDHTFNPVIGCTRVGPGCDHCYAERLAKRLGVEWGPGAKRREASDNYWHQPWQWNQRAARAGKRAKVFCASMADWLDNEWPEGVRERLCNTVENTPWLDWLLLSKRIGNAKKLPPARWREKWPDNAWCGISVVNQDEADRDIPKQLAVPARVRFLSLEPLLGPISLRFAQDSETGECLPFPVHGGRPTNKLHWVIVGGESGPGARPFKIAWAREIRDQCRAAGVPCFVKQLGSACDDWRGLRDRKGGDPSEWPEDLRVREFPA